MAPNPQPSVPVSTTRSHSTERQFWLHCELEGSGAHGVAASFLSKVYLNPSSQGTGSGSDNDVTDAGLPRWRAERKSLLRDIESLRLQWGARIRYDKNCRFWILDKPGTPPEHLRPIVSQRSAEGTSLVLIEKLSEALSGGDLLGVLRDALPDVGGTIDTLNGVTVIGPARMKPTESNLVDLIRTCLEAVQGSRLVTFQYKTPWNDASQWRRVEAWHVLWVQGGWYLIGRLPNRDLTMFALARVDQGIKISSKSYAPSPEHQKQLQGLLAPVDQVYRSGKLTKIRLKVDADFEPVLRDRLWDDADNLRWKQSPDGDWQLWIRAFLGGPDDICTREAARKILAFGPHVRVEHPGALRESVREIAREIMERNDS